MHRKLNHSACLGAALIMSAACVFAQSPDSTASPDATSSTASSVAYVYVSYAPDIKSSNAHKIAGYKAWADGTMTAMPQSTFNDNVETMAVNGKYVMAASNNSTYIETYQIEYGGVLSYVTQTEYAHYTSGSTDCGSAGQAFFDHTGSSLYVQEFDTTTACSNSGVAAFALNKTTGGLSYLDFVEDGAFPGDNRAAYFLGNNVDAYSANNSGCMYYTMYGYRRASNGLLSGFAPQKNSPTPSSSFSGYLPNMAVADPTNHVAVHMQPASPPECVNLPPQIAVYTADSNGYLTTTSTYSNMPVSLVKSAYDMKMSPSGKLLAVGGQEGLQIFHWNGASPATHYTNLITTVPIQQMFWDNANHLFAISQSSDRVYAFTITPTGWSAAPGSPHALPSPYAIIVQPH